MGRTRPNRSTDDLSAWLDGELEEGRAAELEAELQRDPELRDELAELEAVVRLVRDAGPAHAPIGFAHRVLAEVDKEEARHTRSPWAWLRRPWGIPLEGWALGLAAAAALLLLLPWSAPGPDRPADDELHEVSPAALDVSKKVDLAPEADGKDQQQVAGPTVTGPTVTTEPPRGTPPPSPTGLDATTVANAPTTEIVGRASVDATAPTSGEPSAGSLGTSDAGNTGNTGVWVAPTKTTPGTEQTPDGARPPSVRLTVRSGDPRMKRQIVSIISRYGGTARQEGEEVTSTKMGSGSETLTLSLAQTDLQAFTAEIRKYGYALDVTATPELVAGTTVDVQIDLERPEEKSLDYERMPSPAEYSNE